MSFLFFLTILVGLLLMYQFDGTVRWIYLYRRALWETIGKPSGWMWVPAGTGWWSGAMARQQFVTQLFFGSAFWIQTSRELRGRRRVFLFWVSVELAIIALAAVMKF